VEKVKAIMEKDYPKADVANGSEEFYRDDIILPKLYI
jgi:hypothetical protein